jgi:hypothetical protein
MLRRPLAHLMGTHLKQVDRRMGKEDPEHQHGQQDGLDEQAFLNKRNQSLFPHVEPP